ncbi:MAG: hypothetical protein ABW167_10035 [Baekduia sp.]
MAERPAMAVWRSRLRWRLSGAWQWPAFAILTALDAVILARLPFSGGRAELLGCLLAAGLLNLVIVAVGSHLGGWLVRRRRPDLPREIAGDRAAAIGLVALFVVLLAGGLAHRRALMAHDKLVATVLRESEIFAAHRAPARYLPLHGADTVQQGPDVFRTCYAGPDPRRDFCVFIRTDEPALVKRIDPDQRPNATVFGPDNPGRAAR